MAVKVGINGFGRIGRNVFRAAQAAGADIEFVAVNDLTDTETLAHLLKYDSILGRFPGEVEAGEGSITVDGDELKVLAERDPAALPWGELGVDVVIESTGLFTERDDAAKHLEAGAKKVIISRPGQGARRDRRPRRQSTTPTTPRSTTSSPTPPARPTAWRRWPRCCTTRSASSTGLMTTIHAYTNDQRLQDMPHKDLRRARAAALNLIPTTTGAAKAVGLVLPELKGKLNGIASACPSPTGSVVDLVFTPSQRDERRGGQRGDEGGRRGPAEGDPRLHRGPDRLDRHRQATRTRRSSTPRRRW